MNVRDNFGSIGSVRGIDDVLPGSDNSLDDEAVDSFLEVEIWLVEGDDDDEADVVRATLETLTETSRGS